MQNPPVIYDAAYLFYNDLEDYSTSTPATTTTATATAWPATPEPLTAPPVHKTLPEDEEVTVLRADTYAKLDELDDERENELLKPEEGEEKHEPNVKDINTESSNDEQNVVKGSINIELNG